MGLKSDSQNSGAAVQQVRVLVVDANTRRAAAIRRALKSPPTPFVVSPARQLWSATQILSGVPTDAVLLSLDLARSDAETPADVHPSMFPGLKTLQRVAADVPIIILGNEGEAGEQLLQVGAADFLPLPAGFKAETLRQRTLKIVERHRAAKAKAKTSSALQPVASMRIVLVEEDALVRRLLRRNLERRGHRVTPFETAQEAIDYVKGASFDFDLLACDEHLSGMDGVRLSHLLQRYTPTLRALLFGTQPPGAGGEGMSPMGNVFYLAKPYALSEFSEKIEAIEGHYPWPETLSGNSSVDSVYSDYSK